MREGTPRMRTQSWAIVGAVALALLVGLAATAASAQPAECPCWSGGPPLVEPTFCYQSPTAQTNTFAYLSSPSTFLQVTTSWCRNNGVYRWVNAAERELCEQQLQCLCAATNLSPNDVCNGVDDNCNGATDEDFASAATACGQGVCAATGVTFCDGVNGVQDTCAENPPTETAGADLCNGVDGDCDGATDEDFVPDTSCFLPGECAAGNVASTCDGGTEVACETGTPAAEVCDELDNDCDDEIDEGITLASAPAARFDDLGDTVFDCATDLEWEKKLAATDALCTGGTPDVGCVDNTYTWSPDLTGPNGTAFTTFLPGIATALGGTACNHTTWSCTATSFAATDSPTCTPEPLDGCWRLPEIDELKTILDVSVPGCGFSPFTPPTPCIEPIFGPTAPSNYWSATLGDPDFVWSVNFGGLVFNALKSSGLHVRAVRSSP